MNTYSIHVYRDEPRLCGAPTCPLPVAYACWLRSETDLKIRYRCAECAAEFAKRHGLRMPDVEP